jgi:hypothetical protein
VGNGCTDEKFDGNAIIPFTYGMGLIDIDLYQVRDPLSPVVLNFLTPFLLISNSFHVPDRATLVGDGAKAQKMIVSLRLPRDAVPSFS